MTDLSARLREIIEERRMAATNLQRRAQEHDLMRQEPALLGRVIPGWYEWPEVERLAADAILAGERDLGVLERHTVVVRREYFTGEGARDDPQCAWCELTSNDGDPLGRPWPCDEITALAKRYGVSE